MHRNHQWSFLTTQHHRHFQQLEKLRFRWLVQRLVTSTPHFPNAIVNEGAPWFDQIIRQTKMIRSVAVMQP
jgi:hypothetical protein